MAVNHSTPQGSCLGPLVFLLFTNDLYNQLNHCSSILFADDTTLYKVHRNLNYLKWCLQDDMNSLVDWFRSNKLTLNVEKTICILFQPVVSNRDFSIEIDNIEIRNSESTKFLGMWLDQYLTLSYHFGRLVTKLKRNSNLLKHTQKLMTVDSKRLVYFAHIQSHLTYGLILWGNSLNEEQLTKLINIQEKCLTYIDHRPSFSNLKILPLNKILTL